MLRLAALLAIGLLMFETSVSVFLPGSFACPNPPQGIHICRKIRASWFVDPVSGNPYPRLNRDISFQLVELPYAGYPNYTVTYYGTIKTFTNDGAYSWYGKLNVPYGDFYIVYTAGVFIVHVAEPNGVYEASWTGSGNIYLITRQQ